MSFKKSCRCLERRLHHIDEPTMRNMLRGNDSKYKSCNLDIMKLSVAAKESK